MNPEIAKQVLDHITDGWMTIQGLTDTILETMPEPSDINPSKFSDEVALECGFLVGQGKIEHAQVNGFNHYFYIVRKKQ